MRIEHIAVWTNRLEEMCSFYIEFFEGKPGKKYTNESKGFHSYFITFQQGARLEIMSAIPAIPEGTVHARPVGYAHMAFSTGSREGVDSLTRRLREEGYRVVSGPRTTSDGYYESCVLDPDGNMVEITA